MIKLKTLLKEVKVGNPNRYYFNFKYKGELKSGVQGILSLLGGDDKMIGVCWSYFNEDGIIGVFIKDENSPLTYMVKKIGKLDDSGWWAIPIRYIKL
jgi:hypothetical protein